MKQIKVALSLTALLAIVEASLGSEGALRPAIASGSVTGAETFLSGIPPEMKFAVTTLGFGGIAGWSVGFTLKKMTRLMALIIGVAFIAIQFLAFNNYLTINWEKIRESVPDSQMQQIWLGLMSMLTYNFPFAGAFVAGFWIGFRKG